MLNAMAFSQLGICGVRCFFLCGGVDVDGFWQTEKGLVVLRLASPPRPLL